MKRVMSRLSNLSTYHAIDLMETHLKYQNLKKYIPIIQNSLKPPVSNNLMFSGSILKVMLVGGPNQRSDFHINQGEEFFLQLQGNIELKIKDEKCQEKTIPIPENNIFILPRCIPHSPQRYENTIGMVIERLRDIEELDGLRYYLDDSTDILYEKYFYCNDLGKQIKEAIEEFQQSDAYKTKTPIFDYKTVNRDIHLKLQTILNSNKKLSNPIDISNDMNNKSFSLNHDEFEIEVIRNDKSIIMFDEETQKDNEIFLYQRKGEATVSVYNALIQPDPSSFTIPDHDGLADTLNSIELTEIELIEGDVFLLQYPLTVYQMQHKNLTSDTLVISSSRKTK